MNDDNLNPIQPGQKGKNHPAAKPPHLHRNKTIAIRVTADELKKVADDALQSGISITKLGRKLFGLD